MPHFKVENKRVPKINDPLLIIGLGGTGADALLSIKRKFKERYVLPVIGGEQQDKPARTSYLAVDTDAEELRRRGAADNRLVNAERFELVMPNLEAIIENPAAMYEWEKSWWDTRIPSNNARNGAGGFRQVGRLLLFRNADKLVETLKATIGNLMGVQRDEAGGSLNVIIASGISGGTGAGCFMDLPYLIRYIMANFFDGVTVRIQGYLIMPGVNLKKFNNPNDNDNRRLKTNAFASLKELDFWMNWKQHEVVHQQKYTSTIKYDWKRAPYDDVVLIGESREDGTIINNAYTEVMDILSESLLHNFAAEANAGAEGEFTYLSHLSNVVNASMHMNKPFPVNYTYMSVGAANTEAQLDDMVTYEAKLTFDKVMDLVNRPSILGTRVANDALQQVMPQDEDLFILFDAVRPLPSYFSGEAGYEPKTVTDMHGDDALHGKPYRDFSHQVAMDAAEFAAEKVELVYERFEKTVRGYMTDPNFGPFVVETWLNDPENGLLTKMSGFLKFWETTRVNAEGEAAQQLGHITNTLYPDMVNLNKVQRALGLYGKAETYINACQQLYISKRDEALAKEVASGLRDVEKRMRDYSAVILPTFNNLLRNVSNDLNASVSDLLRETATGTDIVSFDRLKDYIDQQMQRLADANQMDATTISILRNLADNSFAVALNQTNKIEGWDQTRGQFLRMTESFVNQLTREINGVSMDQLLEMKMPGSTPHEKQEYLVDAMLPGLDVAATTMLNLLPSGNNEFVEYSYVSVPDNAAIVKAGLEEYGNQKNVTPKYSKINDRIYWLKTYNCLPLYRYANLGDLERVYEDTMVRNNDKGVHLVQKQDSGKSFRSDWGYLPTPIPHLLLHGPNAGRAERLGEEQQKQHAILDEALQIKLARLETSATGNILHVRLKRNENGTIMESEVLKEQVGQVMQDARRSHQNKLSALEALRDTGDERSFNCGNFTAVFGNAMGLNLAPADGTNQEKQRAEREAETARREAVKYFMISQHPDVVEDMSRQLEMYRHVGSQIEEVKKNMTAGDVFLDYAKPFMHLLVFDQFQWGNQNVQFKNVAGNLVELFTVNKLNDTEITLYSHCKPLVLLRILADEKDARIDYNDRRFLRDKAERLMGTINDIPEAEYEAAQAKARDFAQTYKNTASELEYDRGSLSAADRTQNADLMTKMVQETKVFLV